MFLQLSSAHQSRGLNIAAWVTFVCTLTHPDPGLIKGRQRTATRGIGRLIRTAIAGFLRPVTSLDR
jgi:hypothetical protein